MHNNTFILNHTVLSSCSIKVSIGTRNCVVGVEDTTSLCAGSLVAVNVADYPPPCIGRVLSLNGDGTIVVGWLKGGYNKVWSDWMVLDGTRCRRLQTGGALERHLTKELYYLV